MELQILVHTPMHFHNEDTCMSMLNVSMQVLFVRLTESYVTASQQHLVTNVRRFRDSRKAKSGRYKVGMMA